jgi:3-methylcrotonyl-CoA carboxylase alpha subunit
VGTKIRARFDHRDWTADVSGTAVAVDGITGPIDVRDAGDGHWRATHGDAGHEAVAAVAGDVVWVSIDGELFDIAIDRAGGKTAGGASGRDALAAPMPATVVRVAVAPGAKVTRGDTLIVLEAMKMELAIKAPVDGVVTAIHCAEGQLVQPGVALVDFQ